MSSTNASSVVAPTRQRRVELRPGQGFWVVTAALAVSMAFSAAPTPLYALYKAKWGFSTFMITVIFAVYAAGVIVGLIFGGHVSDWYGRRRVLLVALALNTVSAIEFVFVPPLAGLLLARIVCGVAIGLTTATATAYITELDVVGTASASRRGGHRASTTATVANVGGIGLGPLIAGLLAEYAPQPLRLSYIVFAALLIVIIILVALTPETVQRPVPTPPYRRQRVVVPADSRAAFFAATGLGFSAFSVYGVINALAPTLLSAALHSPSRAVAGAVSFVAFASGATMQVVLGRFAGMNAMLLGPTLLIPGLVAISLGVGQANLPAFLLGAALCGAGSGALFRVGIGKAAATATPGTRAEVLAGFFVGTYLGVSLPAISLGFALQHYAASTAVPFFAFGVSAATLLSVRGMKQN